jgi:hypothetical protein
MRRAAMMLLGTTLLGACDQPAGTATPSTSLAVQASASASRAQSSVERDLNTLRAVTNPLHDFSAAAPAGWDTQFPPGCFAAREGAMGLHYLNAANMGTLDPAKPQLVLYEPQRDGSKKLLAVEFLFPGAPTDPAPVLFGRPFMYNTRFQIWALHVWIWQANPKGLFANWNPTVTCAFATTVSTMSHH